MTAEVAIMNKHAIALAADSAVTVTSGSGKKILNTANKIFALSDRYPVAIMIFGSAEFMEVPWETIVKEVRYQACSEWFSQLEEYAVRLVEFISKSGFFDERAQQRFLERSVRGAFVHIRDRILEELRNIHGEKGRVTQKDVADVVAKIVMQVHSSMKASPLLPFVDSEFLTSLHDMVNELVPSIRNEVFEQLPISNSTLEKLKDIALWLFTKAAARSEADSGVVICGFSKNSLFPELECLWFSGIIRGRVKYKRDEALCCRVGDTTRAIIVPFGQAETVRAFMEGVEPAYEETIERSIQELITRLPTVLLQIAKVDSTHIQLELDSLREKLVQDYLRDLREWRKKRFVDPVLEVVASLSKQELATMAEALVNLTSLRKRLTMREEETVGGPIDVAVVSRGDGFIWIRRKHYFQAELNPRYFARYGSPTRREP